MKTNVGPAYSQVNWYSLSLNNHHYTSPDNLSILPTTKTAIFLQGEFGRKGEILFSVLERMKVHFLAYKGTGNPIVVVLSSQSPYASGSTSQGHILPGAL